MSVVAGRGQGRGAAANDPVILAGPGKAVSKAKAKPVTKRAAGSKKKAESESTPPRFVEPQLATLVDAPPPGADWVHEIKYDGYRAITSIGGGRVVIRTRTGLDWTEHVVVDPALVRPAEIDLLIGDASKARRVLGWAPKHSFEELVHMMVDADLRATGA